MAFHIGAKKIRTGSLLRNKRKMNLCLSRAVLAPSGEMDLE